MDCNTLPEKGKRHGLAGTGASSQRSNLRENPAPTPGQKSPKKPVYVEIVRPIYGRTDRLGTALLSFPPKKAPIFPIFCWL